MTCFLLQLRMKRQNIYADNFQFIKSKVAKSSCNLHILHICGISPAHLLAAGAFLLSFFGFWRFYIVLGGFLVVQ